MTTHPLFRGLALALLAGAGACQGAESTSTTPAKPAEDPAQDAQTLDAITVRERPWLFNIETKRAHLLPEVDGTTITVTKKNSVVKLADQPEVIDNNLRALFARLPGLFISEQQTPSQGNMNYRGIGNPQEGEYVLSLQDGIPIQSDWIGFPTLYYLPVPQSIESIALIRGGSSLLYGPEPGPVVNYITRKPPADRELAGRSDQVFGSHSLWSSFNELGGTVGAWDYLVNIAHRQSDGERRNADYDVDSSDMHLGYTFAPEQHLSLDVHAYRLDSGEAGRLSLPQYLADEDTVPGPFNRTWVDRYTVSLSYEGQLDDTTQMTSKLWTGYQDLAHRTASAFVAPQPPPATTILENQKFHYTGLDTRVLHRWGQGSALSAGFVVYQSDSPWKQTIDTDLLARRNDHDGVPRLRQERSNDYWAVFAENVFRFGRFHVVPSVRFERERLGVSETVRPSNLTRPLINQDYRRSVPLWGLGFGNDFGVGHETYVNISKGYRPLRWLDVAGPFGNLNVEQNQPDPAEATSFEAGVHGWPQTGFYYDISLFQTNFKNRIESRQINATDVVNVNTGDTRHRGLEAEGEYDFWAGRERGADGSHLILFANVSMLDAEFTRSLNGSQVGNEPAFAPSYIARAGLTWRKDNAYLLSLSAVSVDSQYWQDSNLPRGSGNSFVPAIVPSYTVIDLAGDYRLSPHWKLLGGVSNLGDRQYYARAFTTGLEPANRRTWYAGISWMF